MTAPRYHALTLAIHPTNRGFGWIAFENPFTIYDRGTVGTPGANKNARCLRRIERLVRRLHPDTIVLEAFEAEHSTRVTRITMLGRAIVALAAADRIYVAIFGRADVRQTFAHLGARTRHEIAVAVAQLFPELASYLPHKRRPWESERWRLSLFCAAALALTHYQRDAESVLDSLSS